MMHRSARLRRLKRLAEDGNDSPLACVFTTSVTWKGRFHCWFSCEHRVTCPVVAEESRPKDSPLAVTLVDGSMPGFRLEAEDGRNILIQTDWDYPGLASNVGWIPCKKCTETDGTVDCKHRTADAMISDAYDHLVQHCDDVFPDPGYFD